MSNRFSGNGGIGFAFFTLVIAFGFRAESNAGMSGLHKGPGEELIAVFTIALAFDFTVAVFGAINATAVRCIVTYLLKSSNVAGFEQNHQP